MLMQVLEFRGEGICVREKRVSTCNQRKTERRVGGPQINLEVQPNPICNSPYSSSYLKFVLKEVGTGNREMDFS